MTKNIKNLILDLKRAASPQKAKILQRFFKTGKGQYGEGDVFLGITVPHQRVIAKKYFNLSLRDLDKMLKSKIHEHRLVALLVLVRQYQKAPSLKLKSQIYSFYLSHTKRINNWDLVDLSAEKIVGPYLENRNKTIFIKLAKSKNLWERRIAILSTFHYIKHRDPSWTLKIARLLIKDRHDLIHKAAGWMLRETGKRCGEKTLLGFLNQYCKIMPRTMLRYAIERLNDRQRQYYLRQ